MTPNRIPNVIFRAAMDEPPGTDRGAKVVKLQRELERVRADIAETERVENRARLVQSAYAKLRRALYANMTREEREAVDGMYLFMHGTNVDMIRKIPSGTDRGEHGKLERDLTMAEAMAETVNTGGRAG